MAKHKGKIIVAAVIVIILAVAWFASGGIPTSEQPIASTNRSETTTPSPSGTPLQGGELAVSPSPDISETTTPSPVGTPLQGGELTVSPSPDISETTTSSPTGTPLSEGELTCTLTVRCDTILNNMGRLNKEKAELVPGDGVIFPTTAVTFYEGESVFNVTQREMRRAGIHMSFRSTPIYNSAYIEVINNLCEFDCGELSGWMYKVNDWFPNYGCSRYQLQPGDAVEWLYSCDLGQDIGGGYAAGGQME